MIPLLYLKLKWNQNIDVFQEDESPNLHAKKCFRDYYSDENIELATPGPSTLKVPIPSTSRNVTAKYPDSPIPASELKKLMSVQKISFRGIERDAKFYRAMKGRDFYEPGALDIL